MKLSENVKQGVIQIIAGILIVAFVFAFSEKIALLKEYGYAGVFLITFLSACTVLMPAPGWAIVIATSTTLDPYLLGVVAGIGSGLGEIVGYNIGDGAAKIIRKNGNNEEIIKKYGALGVFFLAFIPNPLFDVAGIVAGAMKIPLWKFLLATIAGRTLRFILLAYLGAQLIAGF